MVRIREGLERINRDGRQYGKMELIIKKGEIKHINLNYEITDPAYNTNDATERPADAV